MFTKVLLMKCKWMTVNIFTKKKGLDGCFTGLHSQKVASQAVKTSHVYNLA